MKKEFYTAIKTALLTVTSIKSVSVWQNNLINDTDRLQRYPFAFIQFTSVQYTDAPKFSQECSNSQFVVHILNKALDAEDESIFNVSQSVFIAMQRAGFKRLSENTVYDGSEIIDWQITFEAPPFVDSDAVYTTETIAKPPLNLDADFIDPTIDIELYLTPIPVVVDEEEAPA